MTRVPGTSYVVGGAVRDRLLGLPVSDRDHVVVGTTAEAMKAAGFRPVGRDFPVFLHPETHEEYALARTERKVAAGYTGFVFHADPSVTLEADLERRDLTINAMAEDDATGGLVDPFGGRRDLDARIFRHVGPAFGEDPVRVLRLARFAARFDDFAIAPETLTLARAMAAAGEIDALVPERVWQELSRGLMERHPERMFDVLRATDASPRLFPEWHERSDERWRASMAALARAAAADAPLEVRFAVAVGADPAPIAAVEALCERLAVPRAVRDVAVLAARERDPLLTMMERASPEDAPRVVEALERCDAFRRRSRFMQIVDAMRLTIPDAHARQRFERRVGNAAEAAAAVDAAAIARAAADASRISPNVRAARSAAIAKLWKNVGGAPSVGG
jgi:tRNA nucleotidyltransferase (CCA-adding enzyme)